MSSREILIRDEAKISSWARWDQLQVAGWVRGDPSLDSDRMWHVLRHNMHHALSSSVAERALRIRLLQLCLTSGELAVLLCLMIAGDTSIVVSVTCPQTRPLTHTAAATVGAAAPWRPVTLCEYHLKRSDICPDLQSLKSSG